MLPRKEHKKEKFITALKKLAGDKAIPGMSIPVIGEVSRVGEVRDSKPMTEPFKMDKEIASPDVKTNRSASTDAFRPSMSNPARGRTSPTPKPLRPQQVTHIPRPFSKIAYKRNTGVADSDGLPYTNTEDVALLAKLGYGVDKDYYLFLPRGEEREDLYSYAEKVANVSKDVARCIDNGTAFSSEHLKDMDYDVPEGYEVKGDLVCPVEKKAGILPEHIIAGTAAGLSLYAIHKQNQKNKKEKKVKPTGIVPVKTAEATHELKSSNIKAVGYDKENKKLEVAFHSGGNYTYNDVPKSLFDRIKRVKSPGKFFHKHIKKDNKFEYNKLDKKAGSKIIPPHIRDLMIRRSQGDLTALEALRNIGRANAAKRARLKPINDLINRTSEPVVVQPKPVAPVVPVEEPVRLDPEVIRARFEEMKRALGNPGQTKQAYANKLLKEATTFGATRNLLRQMQSQGVKLSRTPKQYVKMINPGSPALSDNVEAHAARKGLYNAKNKVIHVNRNLKPGKSPRNTLFHEAGHATHRIEDPVLGNKSKYTPENTLARERIANNNAINFMRQNNVPDENVQNYIKQMNHSYRTYLSNPRLPFPIKNNQKVPQKLQLPPSYSVQIQ